MSRASRTIICNVEHKVATGAGSNKSIYSADLL